MTWAVARAAAGCGPERGGAIEVLPPIRTSGRPQVPCLGWQPKRTEQAHLLASGHRLYVCNCEKLNAPQAALQVVQGAIMQGNQLCVGKLSGRNPATVPTWPHCSRRRVAVCGSPYAVIRLCNFCTRAHLQHA